MSYKPHLIQLNTGSKCGEVYIILPPGHHHIYIGSSKNGFTRLQQHTDKLRGRRHPNHALQSLWGASEKTLWIWRVVICVRDGTNYELRHIEWALNAHMKQAGWNVLNQDTTRNVDTAIEFQYQNIFKEIHNELEALH